MHVRLILKMRVSMYVRAHRRRSIRTSSEESNLCGIPYSTRYLEDEMSKLANVLGVADTIMRGVALGDLTRTQKHFFKVDRHAFRDTNECHPKR